MIKEKRYLKTTNEKIAEELSSIGFFYTQETANVNQKVFVFEITDELMELFNLNSCNFGEMDFFEDDVMRF